MFDEWDKTWRVSYGRDALDLLTTPKAGKNMQEAISNFTVDAFPEDRIKEVDGPRCCSATFKKGTTFHIPLCRPRPFHSRPTKPPSVVVHLLQKPA